jgi:branched-chain amino acid transport system permease protein
VTPSLAVFHFTYSWFAELVVYAGVFGALATSLNVVTGYGGMFSLGHHGFFAVGAYSAAWFAARPEFAAYDPGSAPAILVFLASGGVAVVAAYVSGIAIGLPCLRLRGDYLAIATLAFAEIVRIVIENSPALGGSLAMYVPRLLTQPSGLAEMEAFRTLYVALSIGLLAVTVVVVRNLVRSAHGRSIVSIREDEVASEILGVWTTRHKMRAFLLGAGFAGLAGWLWAHYKGSIAPKDFDLMVGIKILLIVVLGGLGSLSGSVVASFLLVGIERLLQTGILGETVKDWVQVEYALALILLMLLRPEGLFGRRELSDLFRRRLLRPSGAAGEDAF